MNADTANTVYDILATHAGAPESHRRDFIYYAEEGHSRMEFRFCGALGFGGKVYVQRGRVWVAYYPEDRTFERDEIVKRTNAALDVVLA